MEPRPDPVKPGYPSCFLTLCALFVLMLVLYYGLMFLWSLRVAD